jgi:sister-chromatid-cohesion protein PDS5
VDEHQNYSEDNASGKSKDMYRKAQIKNTKHKHNTDKAFEEVLNQKKREDHPENVLASMQTILTEVLNESEVISEQLSSILLSRLRRENGDISLAAYRLAMNVMKCVAIKLEPNVNLFLTSVMSAKRKSENDRHNYHEIIFNIYQCAPKILRSVIPNLTQKLLSELSDVRLSSVKLLGRIFATPGHDLAEEFQPLLSEFLKRFTDNSVEVRLAAVKYAKECILSNPFRPESSGIIAALSDRLLDSDEAVRKQVIETICDVVNDALKSIPIKVIRQVADCLHDKMVS